jgi:hypothetical protein
MSAPKTAICPECNKVVRQGKPMRHHLHDAHGMTGMKVHLIANPNDRQAAKTKTARRAKPTPRHVVGIPPSDDFDVIEDF